jgi:2,3-diketo-5-methylthio-1-phosphopentane phosphatase
MAESCERPILFLDFDGTISRADVVDAILERLGEPGWQRLEEDWKAGLIGSRQCLAGQLAFVRATPSALNAVVDAIDLDPGFPALMELAMRRGLQVHIVSDGFDYCIHRFLDRLPETHVSALRGRVHASHLEPTANGRWRTAFPHFEAPCDHGCATCKPGVMTLVNPSGAPAIFVGDGLSDRYAALAADVVFAKTSLATHCEREGIPFVAYRDLADVAAVIESARVLERRSRDEQASRESGAGAA